MPDARPADRAADRPTSSPDPSFWGDHPRRERRRRPRRPLPDGPWQRALDVLGAWRADARIGLAMLVIAAVVVGVVWYRIGVGSGSEPPRAATADRTVTPQTGATPAPSTTDRRGTILVHVAGAVATPGVVELASGSRVIDAVEAAGGAVGDADLDRLNLAAKVVDGERVLVQRIGDPSSPEASGAEGTSGSSEGAGSGGGLVHLNTATQTDLEALPGIGPVLAGAIIDERERRGGFRSVQELRDVDGIGEKRFATLAELVTV